MTRLCRVLLACPIALASPLLSACAAAGARPSVPPGGAGRGDVPGLVWESTYTRTAPTIDGRVEKAWGRARPLTVVVREAMGGDDPRTVVLRALHTDDTIYVLAQWPDPTRSDMRDPYVWNPEKKDYDRPSRPDDQFAIEFPMQGDFDINMLTVARESVADVWHWKAGRGNPVGWVDDKRHIVGQRPVPGAKEYAMGGHGTVYIARPRDEGRASHTLKPKPASMVGKVVDSFEPGEPSGSLADVRGKGVHDGKGWTLEMSRKLNTGHNDDAVIDPARDNLCAIAVLDDELYWNHSVSRIITLRLVWSAEFDGDKPARVPDGWRVRQTHPTKELATWQIVSDASAPSKPNVLALTKTVNANGTFNLAIAEKTSYTDLDLTVAVKAVSGREDQGGGPIWRCKDENNYYVCRFNPLEGNYRLYKVVNGKRKQLDSASVNTEPGRWYTVRVTMVGDRITCYLDGKKMLAATDDTFKEAGMIGLWTKADAASSFDKLRAKPRRTVP